MGWAESTTPTTGARANAAAVGTKVELSSNPEEDVVGADVIYADTWVSMGEEEEAKRLLQILAPFEVDEAMMERAGKQAIFMHCLPAHRGEEVTDEVMDGAQSVVFDQAENRLHAQKALLLLLLGARDWA